MARRFATSITNTTITQTLGLAWLQNTAVVASTAGSIAFPNGDAHRIYVCPAAYSEPRKVIFWACIRHEYTGTQNNIPVRLRVAPSSNSTSTRSIRSAQIPSGSFNNPNGFWGSSLTTITNQNALYGVNSANENAISTVRFNSATSEGSQLIYREFDLFDAADADFWSDWNIIAAAENLDEFVAYYFAVERTDGGTWLTSGSTSNFAPVIVSCGMTIVQAPSPNNRTRLYIPCSQAGGVGGISAAAFSGQAGTRGAGFYFKESEFSGDVEIRLITKSGPLAPIGGSGWYQVQVNALENEGTTATQRLLESYGSAASANGQVWFSRSTEFRSSVQDGDFLNMRARSLTGGNSAPVWGWIEVTVTNFNVLSAFFGGIHPPPDSTTFPGAIPPNRYSKAAALFDPLWFEDFESNRILDTRVHGGLLILGSGVVDQTLTSNSELDVSPSASVLNALILPGFDDVTGPNRWVILDSELTSNDPINQAGKRKLTVQWGGVLWGAGGGDYPGTMNVLYVLNVPNTDVIELGPLFDVGAFSPEGCAATSAGLGEPGVLVITNGSAIPKKFNPTAAGSDGEVEDAGIPVPFEGETPQAVPGDSAMSPDGGLELGIYKYRYTFRNCCTGKESNPNPEDITVDTTAQSPAAEVTFSFAGVRIPSDPQICEICLYRTIEGGEFPAMAKVGCFNVDETTTFVDRMSDAALEEVFASGVGILSILNAPMPCVSVVVDFRNRLFGMGDIPNLAPAGTVSVTEGSDIIEGSFDVEWDRCLEGKFIQVGADCRNYEILRVLPPEVGISPPIARLKLTEDYEGTTSTGLSYTICGRPNRLYFSEPLEPEYWPESGFIDIEPGDGDRLMGAVSNFDSLLVCKRRKTYVLRFRENPAIEVIVPSRVSSDIGCVGPRTFAQIEAGSVWLADRGLAMYDGRSVMHVPESEAMNDIFIDPDNANYVRRDRNGRVIDAVGVFYPKREQYLLLLPTVQTDRGCNLMLVWDVKLRNITLLKFCQQFQSMVVAKDSNGNERVYLGDVNGFVWIYDVGDTDGAGYPNATGTVRGTVTFAGVDETTGASVLDSTGANFITGGVPSVADLSGVDGLSQSWDNTNMGLAGACVYTRLANAEYDEPWTVRTIYAATNDRLYVTPQWGPDTPFDPEGNFEYEFMIAPIELDLLFKPQNYGTDDTPKRSWRQIVVHEIENFASQVRIDLLPDFMNSDPEADSVIDPVTNETGQGRIFRMDYSKGRQIKPVGRYIHQFMAVRIRNFAPEEPVRIINHILGEEPGKSK